MTPRAVLQSGARSKPGTARPWVAAAGLLVLVLLSAAVVLSNAEAGRQAADRLVVRAAERRQLGDLTGAARELVAATTRDPRSADAWFLLGKVQEEQQAGSGIHSFRKAAEFAPSSAEVQRDSGLMLHEAGKTDEARELLRRAVRLAPTDQAAYATLGRAYLARISRPEDLRLGIEALTTALELQPGDIQTRYRLARGLYQADDLTGARDQFRTTLSFLADGAKVDTELIDGRSVSSVTWLSIVKGCHHHLAQIARRRKDPQAASQHQRQFDDMNRYIRETYGIFTRLKEKPQDRAAQRRLRELYIRFDLPPGGPSGQAAVRRWIGR